MFQLLANIKKDLVTRVFKRAQHFALRKHPNCCFTDKIIEQATAVCSGTKFMTHPDTTSLKLQFGASFPKDFVEKQCMHTETER